MARATRIRIAGEQFEIDGRATYEGRSYHGQRVEGLLLNSRMVQGIFDDRQPATQSFWSYPDTGLWDPERNTDEFIEAMPAWRQHGLLAFTLNLQGGNPRGYAPEQPWYNSAFGMDGSLRRDYLQRLQRILDRADELGMVVILGYFYFGQDERLRDEAAVLEAADLTTEWLLELGFANVLIEINNECDVDRYEHEILQPHRVHELIQRVRDASEETLLVGTSYAGQPPGRERPPRVRFRPAARQWGD